MDSEIPVKRKGAKTEELILTILKYIVFVMMLSVIIAACIFLILLSFDPFSMFPSAPVPYWVFYTTN